MKYIDLVEGETLVITCVAKSEVPAAPVEEDELETLLVIPPVTIQQKPDGSYIRFVSDLDICNDGSGPAHGDKHHQAMTAYYSGGRQGGQYLNADVDRYIVIPPQIRAMVPGVVMGCRGRVTNLETGNYFDGVIGDIGPDDKTGETAYCLAKKLNPSIDYNSGDENKIYLYELWPDQPATVDAFTYKLQPA
jgi:hypothetical protein